MVSNTRYIFGCSHKTRDIKTVANFEQGLKLPVMVCKDCIENAGN